MYDSSYQFCCLSYFLAKLSHDKLLKKLVDTQDEVKALQQTNAELQETLNRLMSKPFEAVFTLAASKSIDGTAQLVGMPL